MKKQQTQQKTKLPAVFRWFHILVSSFQKNDPMKDFWETRFDELAKYNSDTSRGIRHTYEKCHRMDKMQKEYNDKLKSIHGAIVLKYTGEVHETSTP